MPPKSNKKEKVELVFSDSDGDSDCNIEIESDEEFEVEQYKGPIRTEDLKVKTLNLHKQILLRPETYIGSVDRIKVSNALWVWFDNKMKLMYPHISEGLLRLLIEAISNAIDNVWRSKEFGITCKKIKININKKTGETSVWNDGKPINFKEHEEEDDKGKTKKMGYSSAKVIFSTLLSSTNYDDSEERKTSGRNGYGIKLCNIFSKLFNIELYNPTLKKIYTQTWRDNMFIEEKPKETSCKDSFPELSKGSGYTKVTWIPDFSKFGTTGYDDDIMSVMEKFVYDTAMIVSKYGVDVDYNDDTISVHNLKDYAILYKSVENPEMLSFVSNDCRVVLMASPINKEVRISFVNGIATPDGGVHVDAWCEEIFRPIVNKLNGVKEVKTDAKKDKKQKEKDKKAKEKKAKKKHLVSIDDVYKHFAIFIDTTVDKPKFGNQNKTKLSSPPISLTKEVKGKEQPSVKKTDINKIMKWDVIEKIKQLQELKDLAELNSSSKRGYQKAEGVDHSNFSRQRSSAAKWKNCILCITEGKSAKTYVIQGMNYGLLGVKGRDYIGTLAIRGKFLNSRGKSLKLIAKNKEVKALVNAFGLETNLDYEDDDNFKKLRYGKIVIFADADTDGFHIIGLLYNFFHNLYPSLLKRPGFFNFIRTPIVKVNHKGERLSFYFSQEAHSYIKDNSVNYKKDVDYFKGLGTTKRKDVKIDFGKRPATISFDEQTDELVDNIFNKKKSDFRKDWLLKYDPDSVVHLDVKDYEIEDVASTSFFNNEFIDFSVEHCKRSIPCLYDGLKESQRKILYCAFKRKLRANGKSLKVAQFSGYVAEHSGYHHGEDNLIDTIKGMAVRFVGSNNMPLLFNDGQFGSRVSNGEDGASGRYLFTKQERYTRYVFNEQDDIYLSHMDDNGQMVEKKYYMPCIPLILVNGALGIGTGFSSTIPCYNPLDVIAWIKIWIKTKGQVVTEMDGIIISETDDLVPWYRGFKGEIKVNDGKIHTYGVIENLGKNKHRVTEFPVGKKNISIEKFKDKLEDLLQKKVIKGFNENCDDINIDFIIEEDPDGMALNRETLGLIDTVHTTNMVLFVEEDGIMKLKQFKTVEDILHSFCLKRREYYVIRKDGLLNEFREELKFTNNRIKFINELNLPDKDKNKFIVKDREDEDLFNDLEKRCYDRMPKKSKGKIDSDDKEDDDKDDKDDEDDSSGSYNYLLNMKIRGASKKKMTELMNLKAKIEKDIENLELKTVDVLWIDDLDIIEEIYSKWLPYADESRDDYGPTEKKKKKGGKKGKNDD